MLKNNTDCVLSCCRMGRRGLEGMFIWYLVCIFVISANAVDIKHLNIWPMPKSVSYGYGNLHLSNEFELRTDGSKFADASSILKDAFKRSIDVVRSTHVIEFNTSKIDPSLVLKGIHIVVSSPSDEVYLITFCLNRDLPKHIFCFFVLCF